MLIAVKEDYVTQTSNKQTSMIENSHPVEVSLTDYSDWEAWKKKWLTYEAQTKEWDLIVDEPIEMCLRSLCLLYGLL